MAETQTSRLARLSERLQQDPGQPVKNPTTSYWQLPPSTKVATIQSPQLPDETDIIIIGSGITAASTAKHILETHTSTLRLTILEAREICSGATGRNGGHIKAVPEHTYAEYLPLLGQERTREIVEFTLANVEALLTTLPAELRREGEVRGVESLNLATTEEGFEGFGAAVRGFGLEERGRLVGGEELEAEYDVSRATGGYLTSAGAAWPYRLITALFAELLQQHKDRFTIEAQTPALSIDAAGGNSYIVQTPRGAIKTKTIIHATNGHAGHLLPGLRGPLFPVRGQMTTQTPTKLAEELAGKRSWSITYDAGFDYITQSARSGELFVGGGLAQSYERGLAELGNVDDSSNSNLALAHLGGAMNATFGIGTMSAGVKAAWTGIMGYTSDGLPLVGRLPREATLREGSGEWVAAGFNGYGMANAWLCGKFVADRVLGESDPQSIPRAYEVSAERIGAMSAEEGARKWIAALGLS